MAKRLLILILIVAWFQSCKKNRNPIQWNANYSIPIAYGSLGINNLIADSLLSSNTNSSIDIHYNRNLYQLNLDSLIDLPDNEIKDTFALPFPVGVDFNPGQTFINQPEEQIFNISSVELKEFEIESAVLNYSIKSTIEGEIIYDYTVNSAIDQNGNPFSISLTVPAAQNGTPSTVSGTIIIPKTKWNLEGISGGEINTLLTTINVKVSANNANPISVSNLDTLYIENNIEAISPISAKGYFGQQEIQVGPDTTSLNFLNKIISGSIYTDYIDLNLHLENGVGTDFKLKINELTSIRNNSAINLSHPIIGQSQNINRAYLIGNSVIPSIFSSQINSSNSNINTFIENLPTALGYNINIELNPLGNVSGHNDFIHKNHPLNLDIDLTTPFSFAANQLTIRDTIDLTIADTSGINSGSLYFEITNGFPLSAEINISTLSSTNQLLNPGIIASGIIDANNIVIDSTNSVHVLTLSANDIEEIKSSKKVIIEVNFNTPSPNSIIDFYDYYKIDFKISADFNTTVSIP